MAVFLLRFLSDRHSPIEAGKTESHFRAAIFHACTIDILAREAHANEQLWRKCGIVEEVLVSEFLNQCACAPAGRIGLAKDTNCILRTLYLVAKSDDRRH
jgi:hypothetical protein